MFDLPHLGELLIMVLPKLLIGFLLLNVYIHLSGKGFLAPTSAIDQIGNVALGAIIGGTLFDSDESVWGLITVISVWGGMLLLLRYIVNRNMTLKTVVDGEAVRLMKNGHILNYNFTKTSLSIRDFAMLLRQRGYANLNELKSVWFEYNGQLTVVKKGDDTIAVILVENGVINNTNLDHDEAWLMEKLKEEKVELENIFYAEWHDGKLWIYPFEKEPEDAA